jgi:hypothetical protein
VHAPSRALALLCLAACGAPRETTTPPPQAFIPPAPAATPTAHAAAPPARPPPFTPGCEAPLPKPLPARFELARAMDGRRWEWACRASAKLGQPRRRASGYPDFKVRDAATGACMTLSLEDIGAFVYYAPPGRGEALRDFLLEEAVVRDCTFEIGLDGSGIGPRRVGVRGAQPFEEPMYPSTFEGARRFFEEHPHEASAGQLITAYLELDPRARPTGLEALLGRAVDIELTAFARMERAWLSDIGRKGYCMRAKQLATLPITPELKNKVAADVRRFCG